MEISNESFTQSLSQSLYSFQINEYIICPGGRNAPWVALLEENPSLKTSHFFDERSAAFFALGRAKKKKRPVAIVITSGSAVAEVYPAVMEAFYSEVPLVIISCDRPKSFRGKASPQTVEQAHLFGPYCECSLDLDISAEFSNDDLRHWSQKRPIQLNICYSEPLLSSKPGHCLTFTQDIVSPPEEVLSKINIPFKRPLIILARLTPELAEQIKTILESIKLPLFIEASSQLKSEFPNELSLIEGEVIDLLKTDFFDGVLRIGEIPSSKIWRELERNQFRHIISLSQTGYSGISYLENERINILDSLIEFTKNGFAFKESELQDLWLKVIKKKEYLASLFKRYPQSEMALINEINKHIQEDDYLFLGNSLPIREWNSYVIDSKKIDTDDNRGVNGIDGQISTFLGAARKVSWGIFGDLTTMYDMQSLWGQTFSEADQINIIIINNSGGQIFKRLFKQKSFINSHQLSFEHLARFWGVHYTQSLEERSQKVNLIELKVNLEQTQSLYEKL